jgi:hypothetical protein
MAHDLTEADAFTATVKVPDEGDDATAQSIEDAAQALANRTNHHEIDLAFLFTGGRTATDGAKHVRRVANIAALQAINGGSGLNGECAIVDAVGLYVYSNSDATAADGNWIVAPGSGGGRWRHVIFSLLNAAQGIPRLDATTKVPAAQIPNRLIDVQTASVTPNNGSNVDRLNVSGDTAYHDFPQSIALAAGVATDRIFAEVHFHAKLSGQTAIVRFECDGTEYGHLILSEIDNQYRPYHFISLEIPGSTSARTLKIQAALVNTTGGPALALGDPFILRAQTFRP